MPRAATGPPGCLQERTLPTRGMDKARQAAEDPQSHAEVDLSSPSAIERWSRALGTTDEALQQAVRAVGPRVDKVKDYLGAGAAAADQSGA